MADRFVSESDLEAARKTRQAEWERVRKPSDPQKAPEEEGDTRPLFERLKEVRDKKQAELDEDRRFKNMIRGLDTDESEFLSMVGDYKAKQDQIKKEEEKAILHEFEKARNVALECDAGPSVSALKASRQASRRVSKQAVILRSAIKRKSKSEDAECSEEKRSVCPPATSASSSEDLDHPVSSSQTLQSATCNAPNGHPSALKVVGVLPSLVQYTSSSDSSGDSDSDSDSSTDDVPVLPLLLQLVPEKLEKMVKQQIECDSASSDEQ